MPCLATPALAAALAIAQAQAEGVGACFVVGGGQRSASLSLWMASANGIEVDAGGSMTRAYLGARWVDQWAETHPEPAPVSLSVAVESLSPGLLVVAWR